MDTNSLVVDIGAGVCTQAEHVAKLAKLANKVVCVDPSKEMLEIAKTLEHVDPVLMSAEEWVEDENDKGNMFTFSFNLLICNLDV